MGLTIDERWLDRLEKQPLLPPLNLPVVPDALARCDVTVKSNPTRLFINGAEIGGVVEFKNEVEQGGRNPSHIVLVLQPTTMLWDAGDGYIPLAAPKKDDVPVSDPPDTVRAGRYDAVKKALRGKECRD